MPCHTALPPGCCFPEHIIMKWFYLSSLFLFFLPATAAVNSNTLDSCFIQAGKRYSIDPGLLKVIARKESSLNPRAINHNRNASGKIISTDYGLMQINSTHIPGLKRMGIIRSENELLSNVCLNIQTGAWILARHFQQCGVNWECLGSYNAGFNKNNTHRRMKYARLIYAAYMQGR